MESNSKKHLSIGAVNRIARETSEPEVQKRKNRRSSSPVRYQDVVYIRPRGLRKIPKVFTDNTPYVFLQYTRYVFKWAIKNNDLSRIQIEALLFLYPLGIFPKRDFSRLHKTVGLLNTIHWKILIDAGWIAEWRPYNQHKGQPALYSLTQKANLLMKKLHLMMLGEIPIPLKVGKKQLREDKFFLKEFDRHNKSIKKPT